MSLFARAVSTTLYITRNLINNKKADEFHSSAYFYLKNAISSVPTTINNNPKKAFFESFSRKTT